MKKRAFPPGIFFLSALLLLAGIFYFVSSQRQSGEEMLSLPSPKDSGRAKRPAETPQKATGITASAPASIVPAPVSAMPPVQPSSLASPASGVADGFELPADLNILEVLSSLTKVVSTPDEEIDGRMLKQTTLVRTGLKFSLIRVMDSVHIPSDGSGKRLIKREIMVGRHFLARKTDNVPDEDFRRAMASHGVQASPSKYSNGAWKLIIPEGAVDAYEQIQEALSKDPLLRVVEPDYVVTSGTLPNDPRFSELWGLYDAPSRAGGQPVDIGAPEAWSVTTGSMDVTVAVIDTGVDSTHPDLAANMASNAFEVPGNGMDDDGNGFVDDSRGWDFYSDDNDPKDEHFHGTHVAGIIGAVGGNGVGVTGVTWKVQILPVRFLGPTGSGFTSDAELSVRYATTRGAAISNNSWGGGSYSQILKEAIEDAGEQGSIFVASAGNLEVDTDALPQYPSAYPVANLVSVAAITRSGTLAAFSNYGRTSVDVGAPGVGILSTLPISATTAMTQYGLSTSYGSLSGTSMAAPHVSGSLALLKSADASLSGQSLLELLYSGVEPLQDLRGLTVTEGRVQVFQSLRNLRDLRVLPNGYLDFHALAGNMPLAAEAQIQVSNPLAVAIPWTVSVNVPWVELSHNGGTLNPGDVQTITVKLKSTVAGMNAGTYEGILSIRNLASGSEIQRKISLRLQAPSTLPFTENFEQKELSPVWERTGTGPYRTAINSNYQPQQGTGHLILDSSVPLVRARNELTCTLNLAGYQNVVMTFYAKSFSDEPDAPISNPFQHGTDHDGLSVSADGGTTWFEIHPLRNLGTEYEKIALNLDELVAVHGLDYTSGFKIRFTQVDDFPAPTDGIALDAISITGDRTNGLQLATQSEIKEGGPVAYGTITLPAAAFAGLVASISTDRPDRLQWRLR